MKKFLIIALVLISTSAFAQSYYTIRQGNTVYLYSDQVTGNQNNSLGWVQVQPREPIYPQQETITNWDLNRNNIEIINRSGRYSNSYRVFQDDDNDD